MTVQCISISNKSFINKGKDMERVHFKEVVKKLNELKQSGNKQALEQFRNTKVSELHYLFK